MNTDDVMEMFAGDGEPRRRTPADEWLAQVKMFLPFAQVIIGTGGPPLIFERPGHACVIFKNDFGETLRIDYDDGMHCDEIPEDEKL